MKICYFGDYAPDYARNRIIMRGLHKHGHEIIECNVRGKGISRYSALALRLLKLRGSYDLIIVGYADSRFPIVLARLLGGTPVVWDGFYSLYDSWIFDRRLAGRHSVKAGYYWFLDWLNCWLANLVICDTNQHIDYFCNTFRINPRKFIRVFVGEDNEIFSANLRV